MECIQRTLKKKRKEKYKAKLFSHVSEFFAHVMKRTNIDFYYWRYNLFLLDYL